MIIPMQGSYLLIRYTRIGENRFSNQYDKKNGIHTVKKQKSGRAIGEITASGLRNAIEVAKTTSVTRIIVLDDKVLGR